MTSAGTPVSPERDARHMRRSFLIAAGFVALLWAVELFEAAAGLDLGRHSVYPGRPDRLYGILLAPLLHGSFTHLIANSPPLLILGTALLYGYPRAARIVLPVLYLGTGLAVWLFARPAYHLGASGIVFGLMSFVFTIGALRWDRRAIGLSMVVFLLYGGMIWGVLPTEPGISFESHLAGAVLGLVLAVLLRNLDPRPPEKQYSWELEDEDDDWASGAFPPDDPKD